MNYRPKAASIMSLQQEDEFSADFPSWDLTSDVLGGLDGFIDSTPSFNFSEHAHFDVFLPASGTPELQGPTMPTAKKPISRTSQTRSSITELRKQNQNRTAQRRFRARQRVRARRSLVLVLVLSKIAAVKVDTQRKAKLGEPAPCYQPVFCRLMLKLWRLSSQPQLLACSTCGQVRSSCKPETCYWRQ